MKIRSIEAIPLRLPLVTEAVDGTQDTLLIRVETDEGICGWGEVDSSPMVAQAVVEAPMSHGIAQGLRGILAGRDPFDIEQLWELMCSKTIYYGRQGVVLHAISGVDIALWDILGKATGKPVHKLLGGSYRSRVRTYASVLMPETPTKAEDLAKRCIRQGFTALKLGWGPLGQDESRDVELIAAARSGAGDADLMIDAGQAYSLKEALRLIQRVEKFHLHWFEEPLPPDDLQGYRCLREAVTTDIAAGEAEAGRLAFKRLIESGAVDIAQPDVARAGGLTEARKIAMIARDANVRLVPHVFKSDILLAASLHFLATLPDGDLVEFSLTDSPLRKDLLLNPLSPVNGYVQVPDTPGLGIEIDLHAIAKYGDGQYARVGR